MKKIIIIITIITVIYFIQACSTDLDNDNDIIIPGTDIEEPIDNIEFNNNLEKIIYKNRRKKDNELYKISTKIDEFESRVAFDVLKIKYNDIDKFAISMSKLKIEAYCVAIILPEKGKKQDIYVALNKYKESKIDYFNDKLKSQLMIAENAIISYYKDYIIIIMCEGNVKLYENIRKELRKQ